MLLLLVECEAAMRLFSVNCHHHHHRHHHRHNHCDHHKSLLLLAEGEAAMKLFSVSCTVKHLLHPFLHLFMMLMMIMVMMKMIMIMTILIVIQSNQVYQEEASTEDQIRKPVHLGGSHWLNWSRWVKMGQKGQSGQKMLTMYCDSFELRENEKNERRPQNQMAKLVKRVKVVKEIARVPWLHHYRGNIDKEIGWETTNPETLAVRLQTLPNLNRHHDIFYFLDFHFFFFQYQWWRPLPQAWYGATLYRGVLRPQSREGGRWTRSDCNHNWWSIKMITVS